MPISQPTSQPVNQLVSLSFQLIRKVKVIRSNDILRLTFRLFNEITNKPRNETRMKLSQAAPRSLLFSYEISIKLFRFVPIF